MAALSTSSELPQFMDGRYDICERNTFLDFPAPKPLPLEKAQTDPPPGLEGIYGSRKFLSETEHSEDSTAADDADEAPPPLPLEVFVTPDCFEDRDTLDLPSKPLSAAAPAFIPYQQPVLPMDAPFESTPRPRKQISLEEMLGGLDNLGPDASTLVPMPVAGGEPRWLPAPPVMPAPMLAEPPSPEVPAEIAVAGPNLPENELQPGQLVCQALADGSWDVVALATVQRDTDQLGKPAGSKLYNTTVRLVSSSFMLGARSAVLSRLKVGHSSQLDIPNVGSMPFKAFLHPKVVINNKRGGGFKKAKGKGSVVLKCEAEDASSCPKMHVAFRVGRVMLPPRIVEAHDFAEQSCCCLPDTQQEWDFRSLVDEATGAMLVSMRVEVAL